VQRSSSRLQTARRYTRYGEKAEETQELQMDLQDFRQLYQAQTTQLCGQIEELTKQIAAKKSAGK
jgi:hypothetical protein